MSNSPTPDPEASGLEAEREALRRAGLAVYELIPAGIERAEFDYSEAGGVRVGSVGLYDAQGNESSTPETDAASAAASELRRVMFRPGTGTWFSAQFRVSSAGRLSTSFDYDERPPYSWIDDQAFVDDHATYPRSTDATPRWLADLLAR